MLYLILILTSSLTFAGQGGLDLDALKAQKIVQPSRACCNFTSHPVLDSLGLFQFIDPNNMGNHSYGQKQKDAMGITYTCGGGFIDVAHLRDNADWTAHILLQLPQWLGTGQTIEARREGGFKSRKVFFPKMPREKVLALSQEDLSRIAIAMSFGFATLHEITTGFDIAVSFPVTLVMYERASSFSVEDQYSNLLGGHLGAEAILAPGNYDEEMSKALNRTMKKLAPIGLEESKTLHATLKNIWWQKDLLGRNRMVQKRNYAYKGDVLPVPVPNVKACEGKELMPLEVPEKLSTGELANSFFVIRVETNALMKRQLKKHGLKPVKVITQKDYPQMVPVLEREFAEEFPKR